MGQLCKIPEPSHSIAPRLSLGLKRGYKALVDWFAARRAPSRLPSELVFSVEGTVADAMASLKSAYVHQLRSLPPSGATLDLLSSDGARAMELTYWWGDILVDRWRIAVVALPQRASGEEVEVRVQRTISPHRRASILLLAAGILTVSTVASLASIPILPTLAYCLLFASVVGWWMTLQHARGDDHEHHAHRVLAAAWGGKQIHAGNLPRLPMFRR